MHALEQERRRLSKRLEEVSRLAESSASPVVFYSEMLKRLLESLAAPAGAVWTRTAQGNLQQQFQINLKEVGIDRNDESRTAHEELLRRIVSEPRAMHLMPRSGVGAPQQGKPAAGNPTDFLLLLVPVMLGEQVGGILEVWVPPNRPQAAIAGFLQFMSLMAAQVAVYQRNQLMGVLTGQQQLWVQLEAFARQIHSSLNPIEVAYMIANDGRRLIECDRLSVAIRMASKARIAAVSGAEVVEKRSALVQRMRKLCDAVIRWGEKLTFNGVRDDGLPPRVLKALDAYLEVSSSKLLVVLPLRDEREGKDNRKPSRAALLMECFEPPAEVTQLNSRLDIIAKHATPALYNAIQHRRIPMRWVWMPMAALQEGLGGKGKAISALVIFGLSLLTAAMFLVPYPLKMDAKGELLPEVRRYIYSPVPGRVENFYVRPNENVPEEGALVQLFDFELFKKLNDVQTAASNAAREAESLERQSRREGLEEIKREDYRTKAEAQRHIERSKIAERDALVARTGAKTERQQWGKFDLKAPGLTPWERNRVLAQEDGGFRKLEWTVLSNNYRDDWGNRQATPADPLLRLGAKDGPWEIEMKIPQKHIGQVKKAFDRLHTDVLDVDFLLRSDPTRTYKGKLHKHKIGGEATPNRDDNNESEPYVLVYVDIDDKDIDPAYRLPNSSLVSGTEVHAKVRCGDHSLGYSLFYGVWEFLYEKVVFFF
jgi:hypothetical protein